MKLSTFIAEIISGSNIIRLIYIFQESDGKHFNRGAIKNAGFLEAIKADQFDCVLFQDVDKMPEHTGNFYTCSSSPKLLIGETRYTNQETYKR